jgi:hypothetical protein
MQRVLSKFRNELSVPVPPNDMEAAAARTMQHLQSEAAKLTIKDVQVRDNRLEAQIMVENMGGHKLPTAYPSRRVWLHVTVKDRNGRAVFESGALRADGSIDGNDNDADPLKYEPHYTEVTRPDQVQIYEDIMVGANDKPTTGLLTALRYVKDNRLLPLGFDKRTADDQVAVHGAALNDPDFTGGSDTIRYSMATNGAQGPFQLEVELWYQPIAFRWAMNLKQYTTMEPQRFVGYYETMAPGSGVRLAEASATR